MVMRLKLSATSTIAINYIYSLPFLAVLIFFFFFVASRALHLKINKGFFHQMLELYQIVPASTHRHVMHHIGISS